MSDRLEANARTVSLLTLVSRITGLVRDAAMSRVFGAGPLMSAFFFAFIVPNLFRRLFGEGALASAFLPRYTRLIEEDPPLARALASRTVAFLVIVVGAVTLLTEALLSSIAIISGETSATIVFLMLMLPYMPLVCAVALFGAMLHTRGRFGPTAAAPIVLNLCLIIATIAFAPMFAVEPLPSGEGDAIEHAQQVYEQRFHHLIIVGIALLVAGVIQIAWSMYALRTHPWWTTQRDAARAEFRAMLRTAGPMILSLGVLQLNTFFDGIIASYPVTFETSQIFGIDYPLDDSAMAVLSFGQRLYQFPLGVFGIAVATAIYPLLAANATDQGAFTSILRRGLRLVVFIGLPASAGLILVRDPLTAAIYQGGEFTAKEGARVGSVLLGYAPAIWAYSMTHVLTRAFYAKDDSRTPMKIAIGMVVLNLVLNIALIWPFAEMGLALSTAICAIVQVALLLVVIRPLTHGTINRETIVSWGKTVLVTAIMVAAVLTVTLLLPQGDHDSWSTQVGRLLAMTGTGMAFVGVTALALRMPELRWALGFRQQER